MRLRRAVLLLLAIAVVVHLARRREPAEYVEVDFDDGSSIRFGRGAETRDLLGDANDLVELVA